MRPVTLEMSGFGSFREPTTVDFEGADYFALVGPTGSGKSTVIDALTFALYGSVPRWDNPRTVALALAPTVGRGSVKLEFEVAGERYVVARELRRAASGSVSVRGARLERGEQSVADGANAVTAAVEQLLGLPFDDFCTCVVLPQGEFAEFLHTEPRKRQEKLVRILGLGVYDVIAKRANSEAAAAKQRAEILAEQLGAYTDATEEAEQATAARVAELDELAGRTATALPELAAAAEAAGAAEQQVTRLRREADVLRELTAPAGLDALDSRHDTVVDAVRVAAEAAAAHEASDSAAREALAAAPSRSALDQLRRDHAELAELVAELPGATERHEKAGAAYTVTARDAADALQAAADTRAAAATAAAALDAAREAVRRVTAERDGLRAVTAPAGLEELAERRSAAVTALASADAALDAAENADAAARAALAAAPERGPLEQARRERRELTSLEREHSSAVAFSAEAVDAVTAAAGVVDTARHRLAHGRAEREAALRADVAATLRPGLVEGDDCPVCAQPVATLPPPASGPDLATVERAVAAAEAEHEAARRAAASAEAARVRATDEVDRLAAAAARLRVGLTATWPVLAAAQELGGFAAGPGGTGEPGESRPAGRGTDERDPGEFLPPGAGAEEREPTGGPDQIPALDVIDAALAALDRLTTAATAAADEVRVARRVRDQAATAADDATAATGTATAALRAARDPLVPIGAPATDGADVVAGWRALVDWAAAEAAARDTQVPGLRAAVTAAEQESTAAAQALDVAERAATDRRRDETAAARVEQEARSALTGIEQRVATLTAAVRDRPNATETATQLARVEALDAAVRAADTQLRAARTALRAAEADVAALDREVAAAWDALRAARDPLVPLGAPAASGAGLRAAWATLVGWAGDAAAERTTLLTAARAAHDAALTARAELEQRIAADLAGHTITAGVTDAAAAVAAALASARSAHDRLVERRAAAGKLLADRDEAESAQQVAAMLGRLLRSDGFPRWLVASALDTLVADASRYLIELSGGQFTLTHEGGEFLVVDHADADALRPVKTLSGGETFQASLALALALSSQLAGLAAHGGARLDSIFLDEGFGTLDDANLDVVASTLENLATHGDRMVGVITHVPALAERVPVRYVVSRDQRTSTVEREGP